MSLTQTQSSQPLRFLRAKDVLARTGLSKADLYRRVAAKTFPPQKRISHRVAVWIEAQVVEWQEQQLRQADSLLTDLLG